MAKKDYRKDTKRTEVVWNLKKDSDVITYLEENVDNISGFLKMLARDYVRNKVGSKLENTPVLENSIKNVGENTENSIEEKKEKKRLPLKNTAFSSKDLGLKEE